uniref:AlNc14C56G4263 protein n=1 Tax=Albugo laibachii Nc14 TaxID=890382 RepID=F0WC80_9STRA|nr:AlNc14C56G4263 [Albugo laibachii Nc14]|eukprot:CCA18793.1 AlNc14C56G4263 [Albugo laibachii Nc14]
MTEFDGLVANTLENARPRKFFLVDRVCLRPKGELPTGNGAMSICSRAGALQTPWYCSRCFNTGSRVFRN